MPPRAEAVQIETVQIESRRTELLQEEYLTRQGDTPGGFEYFYPGGRRYRDAKGLARIAALAVPPCCSSREVQWATSPGTARRWPGMVAA